MKGTGEASLGIFLPVVTSPLGVISMSLSPSPARHCLVNLSPCGREEYPWDLSGVSVRLRMELSGGVCTEPEVMGSVPALAWEWAQEKLPLKPGGCSSEDSDHLGG